MRTGMTQRAILLISLLVLLSGFGLGQTERSTQIRGKVIDQMGAVIPETKVTLTDASHRTYEDITNENGNYSLRVPSGTYSIKAQYLRHAAWEVFSIENYEVANSDVMNLDIALRINKAVVDRHGIPGLLILPNRPVTKDEAIDIARRDAAELYYVEKYDIVVTDEGLIWRVRFELKNKQLERGGPEYTIEKKTGKIKTRKYLQ